MRKIICATQASLDGFGPLAVEIEQYRAWSCPHELGRYTKGDSRAPSIEAASMQSQTHLPRIARAHFARRTQTAMKTLGSTGSDKKCESVAKGAHMAILETFPYLCVHDGRHGGDDPPARRRCRRGYRALPRGRRHARACGLR
jgi:hypothetical protein